MEIRRQVETIQPAALKKIGQNIEKYPEDLRRLAVTQTPVRNHQLSPLLKTLKSIIIIIIIDKGYKRGTSLITDMSVLKEYNISMKEYYKIRKYNHLQIRI